MATKPSISVWTSLVVMSAVLLTTYAGPMCYDCTRIPYPRDCGHVRQCSDGEICETRLFVSDSGNRYFDTGCQSKDRCLSTRDVSAVTYDEMDDEKGDITVCNECCHEDFCNTHGCGSQPLPELSARGPICFNCNQQQSPDSCEIVTVCSHGEVCSLLRYHSSIGDILYTSSCKYESFCTALQGVVQPAIVGRRSVTGLCMGCCNIDHCNRNCTVVTNIHPSQPETTSSIPLPTHAMMSLTTYVTTQSNAHTTTPSTAHVTTESNAHMMTPSMAHVTTQSNAHTTKPLTAHVTTQSNAPTTTPSTAHVTTQSNEHTTTPSTTYVTTQSTTTLAPDVLNNCSPVPDINNGYLVGPNSTAIGVIVKYNCSRGYTFLDKDTTECVDGYWTILPMCEPIVCPAVPDLANGYLVGPNDTFVGVVVQYNCTDGYSYRDNDNGTIECLSSGPNTTSAVWSELPVCRPAVSTTPSCIDKPGLDCHIFNVTLQICKDPTTSQLFCPRYCGLCGSGSNKPTIMSGSTTASSTNPIVANTVSLILTTTKSGTTISTTPLPTIMTATTSGTTISTTTLPFTTSTVMSTLLSQASTTAASTTPACQDTNKSLSTPCSTLDKFWGICSDIKTASGCLKFCGFCY